MARRGYISSAMMRELRAIDSKLVGDELVAIVTLGNTFDCEVSYSRLGEFVIILFQNGRIVGFHKTKKEQKSASSMVPKPSTDGTSQMQMRASGMAG
jgi:hypothetical protein